MKYATSETGAIFFIIILLISIGFVVTMMNCCNFGVRCGKMFPNTTNYQQAICVRELNKSTSYEKIKKMISQ